VRARYNQGHIEINLYDLWNEMDNESKKVFLKDVVWEPDVFEDIIKAICGDEIVTSSFSINIYNARQKILESLGKLETNHFRSLMHELEQAKLDYQRVKEDYWSLYHAIPKQVLSKMIQTGKITNMSYKSAEWPSDDEVKTEMQRRKGE